MKFSPIGCRVALLSAAVSSLASAHSLAGNQQATSQLFTINNSGIAASIRIIDKGTELHIIGKGVGFTPGLTYVSLVYNAGSVATGPAACLPTNRSIPFNAMVLGAWDVNPSGHGNLSIVKSGPLYTPLNLIGTVSVRQDTQPGQPLPANPDPVRFQLKACGAVVPSGN